MSSVSNKLYFGDLLNHNRRFDNNQPFFDCIIVHVGSLEPCPSFYCHFIVGQSGQNMTFKAQNYNASLKIRKT